MAGATLLQIPDGKIFYWREGGREGGREGADEIDFVLTVGKRLYGIEIKSGRTKNIQGREAFLARFPNARMALVALENYPAFAEDPLAFLEKRSVVG